MVCDNYFGNRFIVPVTIRDCHFSIHAILSLIPAPAYNKTSK